MTREEMWKVFEKQLIRETRTPITVSYDVSEKMTKSAIERTVAKWKERLEQEPFINKSCVSSGVCEHDKNEVLDKIRAEILEEHENAYAREDNDVAYGLSVALDIIDKYKAESEIEDGND